MSRLCLDCNKPNKRYYKRFRVCTDCMAIRARNNHLLREYGITLETYEDLYDKQYGHCAICGLYEDKLHIDHDHKTGRIRGLVCIPCNTGLGSFRDNPIALDSAAKYLRNPPLDLQGKVKRRLHRWT